MLRRYPLPMLFIVAFCAVSAVYAYGLGPDQQRVVVSTTATNLVNLRSDPFGTMVASAFVAQAVPWMWVVLAIVGLFPVAHRFGNVRTLALVGAAQVIGTLISEGLLAWRISTGAMPASMRYLDDVGPSYVIASALVATMLYGAEPLVRTARHGHWLFDRVPSRWWRIGAGLALAFLAPHLFSGLDRLGVAAVGHLIAMLVGAAVGLMYVRRERSASKDDDPGTGSRTDLVLSEA
ncbi:MAG: rhomboid-like protein [Actinoallomurus sp.]